MHLSNFFEFFSNLILLICSDSEWDSTQESEPYSPNRSTHDLASLTSSFVNIDLDPSSPRRNPELSLSGSSFASNTSSSSSLSSISLNASIEPLGNSGEDNKDNSGESDQPDQTKKTGANLDANNEQDKIDKNSTKEEEKKPEEKPKEPAPEITIVQPDQVTKTSSKEHLTKSSHIDADTSNNTNQAKDSLNISKDTVLPNGGLKASADNTPNLSPQKPEELTPKKRYVIFNIDSFYYIYT